METIKIQIHLRSLSLTIIKIITPTPENIPVPTQESTE
jgi:hypothetical protein